MIWIKMNLEAQSPLGLRRGGPSKSFTNNHVFPDVTYRKVLDWRFPTPVSEVDSIEKSVRAPNTAT